jgi:Tol biopolymer transport system component
VWIVRPDGSQLRRLRVGSVADAAWAADSRHVLVTGSRGIELVGLDGRTEPLPHARHGAEAAVSPDGRWIAFAAYENLPYAFGIAVEHADGTGFRLLTHGSRSHSDDNPAWSPTGRTIAFTRGYYGLPQEYSGIVTVGLEGRHVRPLEDQFTAHDERPRWSPDGRTIVFDRDAAVEPIGEDDRLYVGDVRTGRVRELYRGTSRGEQSWRPR